jgi:cysteine desulfurase
MKQIYLDNAATTKVDGKVLKSMLPYFSEKYGNASSQHLIGQEAKRVLEESRSIIAKSINARDDEIIFTSGGTESNNLALKGLFFANKEKNKNHIIISKIEHDCILNASKWLEKQGAEITYLDVNKEGFVNPLDVEKAITDKTIVVSIIHGNNEIGTIQNIEEIGKICKEKNTLFHTDACQSYTKAKINVKKQNLDLVTLNAHKIQEQKIFLELLDLQKLLKIQISLML